MPGMLEHLQFNCNVYDNLRKWPRTEILENNYLKIVTGEEHFLGRDAFLLGGIIPDLAVDHNLSHYKVFSRKAHGIFVPDLAAALRQMPQKKNSWPLRMGVYAHLYLDYHFLSDFLIPRYLWNLRREGRIENLATRAVYTTEEFFSAKGLYGAYGELNLAILERGLLDLELIRSLPDKAPEVGAAEMDERDERPWKERFEGYLTHRSPITNKILPVEEYLKFSAGLANRFAAEMLHIE
ncbi:hypothetical protein IJ103_00280 [Candidatus Saccharibacteria bacterium]|nr:hypothetical protein [Candidatus Saccharibacteria bacterium]